MRTALRRDGQAAIHPCPRRRSAGPERRVGSALPSALPDHRASERHGALAMPTTVG
jgi:hypothetical protein